MHLRLPLSLPRESLCDLEIDIRPEHILNRTELDPNRYTRAILGQWGADKGPMRRENDEKLVHSLAQIWEDERIRLRQRSMPSQVEKEKMFTFYILFYIIYYCVLIE